MRCDVLGNGDLDSSLIDDPSGSLNTDIQVWRESTDSRRSSSLTSCECRELARIYASDKSDIIPAVATYSSKQRHCKRGGAFEGGNTGSTSTADAGHSAVSGSSSSTASPSSSSTSASSTTSAYDVNNGPDNESAACDNPDGESNDDDEASNLVESSLPAAVDKRERSKEFEIRKLKSNCKPEELQKLKLQCEVSCGYCNYRSELARIRIVGYSFGT